MREEACSADTIIRDEDALREPYVREGEQTLTKIIDALKSGTDLSTVKKHRLQEGSRVRHYAQGTSEPVLRNMDKTAHRRISAARCPGSRAFDARVEFFEAISESLNH